MLIMCAWCEEEGQPGVTRDAGFCASRPPSPVLHSHGICEEHALRLWFKTHLRRKHGIRQIPRRLGLPNARGDRSPITVMYL